MFPWTLHSVQKGFPFLHLCFLIWILVRHRCSLKMYQNTQYREDLKKKKTMLYVGVRYGSGKGENYYVDFFTTRTDFLPLHPATWMSPRSFKNYAAKWHQIHLIIMQLLCSVWFFYSYGVKRFRFFVALETMTIKNLLIIVILILIWLCIMIFLNKTEIPSVKGSWTLSVKSN